jgi:hypothetical protein
MMLFVFYVFLEVDHERYRLGKELDPVGIVMFVSSGRGRVGFGGAGTRWIFGCNGRFSNAFDFPGKASSTGDR